MKEIYAQLTDKYELKPVSEEYLEDLKTFTPNQIVKLKVSGTRKQRSVLQNRWLHAIFKTVADNTSDPEWNTTEIVKRNVKMTMKFFKDEIIVHNNKVWFELRSFAFDKMDHNEANRVYDEAKEICAKKLGVNPEDLEMEIKGDYIESKMS